ncbi:hypothetical protein QJS66_09890 [Kocuria rhizophila]|nr:hypothetical protein QJS66_09890 [Kocuria rhizophila]
MNRHQRRDAHLTPWHRAAPQRLAADMVPRRPRRTPVPRTPARVVDLCAAGRRTGLHRITTACSRPHDQARRAPPPRSGACKPLPPRAAMPPSYLGDARRAALPGAEARRRMLDHQGPADRRRPWERRWLVARSILAAAGPLPGQRRPPRRRWACSRARGAGRRHPRTARRPFLDAVVGCPARLALAYGAPQDPRLEPRQDLTVLHHR